MAVIFLSLFLGCILFFVIKNKVPNKTELVKVTLAISLTMLITLIGVISLKYEGDTYTLGTILFGLGLGLTIPLVQNWANLVPTETDKKVALIYEKLFSNENDENEDSIKLDVQLTLKIDEEKLD
ncbi:hypothetical protein [Pontibacillus halophilus]|uniref:hypothetical protein n=1 Tax=Pontibacillus halophilus TaxID=516704 RepID=UPI001377BC16|nr:hypothetical protein [Pontibacillus halophilus]